MENEEQTTIEEVREGQTGNAASKARDLLRSQYGLWTLSGISFIEAALVVPLVTDPFLMVYVLADKRNVKKAVILATIASALGGIFAYAMAFWFYEFIAAQYLTGGIGEQFYDMVAQFKEGTFVLTLLGALTPIPYTVVALAAGFVKGSFIAFVAASVLGRGFRYIVVGYLTYRFGNRALLLARKRFMFVAIATVCVVVIYFVIKAYH